MEYYCVAPAGAAQSYKKPSQWHKKPNVPKVSKDVEKCFTSKTEFHVLCQTTFHLQLERSSERTILDNGHENTKIRNTENIKLPSNQRKIGPFPASVPEVRREVGFTMGGLNNRRAPNNSDTSV